MRKCISQSPPPPGWLWSPPDHLTQISSPGIQSRLWAPRVKAELRGSNTVHPYPPYTICRGYKSEHDELLPSRILYEKIVDIYHSTPKYRTDDRAPVIPRRYPLYKFPAGNLYGHRVGIGGLTPYLKCKAVAICHIDLNDIVCPCDDPGIMMSCSPLVATGKDTASP